MRRSPLVLLAVPLLLLALAAAPSISSTASQGSGSAPSAGAERAARAPALVVRTVVRGLNHPWDVKPIGDGRLLMTERNPARLSLVSPEGRRVTVRFPTSRVWQSGETGLMGLEVDPNFRRNHRFFTCSGWKLGGGRRDIRVIAWRLVGRQARPVRTMVAGLPTVTGRHGGCRLLITRGGALLVGTGDAAVGTNPRNLDSLGGKVLRLDRVTGRPARGNPFYGSSSAKRRYVYSFGHRNVQGLAQRGDGSVWSVEHGTDRDDEVNRIFRRGDYGYHPVPGYNESVPMTDQRLPGKQVSARWRSGRPTLATSGATFVQGSRWGSLEGTLAVAALKAQRVVFMRFDADGRLRGTTTPAALRRYGRLRTVEQLPGGALLVLTDGDGGAGRVLRVLPRS